MNTGTARRAADISGQQKNLLIAEPMARLEADTNVRARMLNDAGAGEARLDLRLIALSMLDHIMEETAFHPGALAESILEIGKTAVSRMDPTLSEKAGEAVSRRVFDHIRNATGRYREFQVPYHDAAEGVWRTHAFRYVETVPDPDDTTLTWVRLATGGKKLLLGMLDVADDLLEHAERAIMTKALERERYQDALTAANRARARSADFRQRIDTQIAQARRNTRTLNMATDVLPTLNAALAHVRERIGEDQGLVARLDDKLADLSDADQRAKAVELRNTLQECLSIHNGLFRRLTTAHGDFRDTILRGMRSTGVVDCRDPEQEILLPLLGAPIGAVAAHADLIATCFSSVHTTRILDLRRLLEDAIMECTEPAEGPAEEDGVFVSLPPPNPLFTPERIGAVGGWLDRTIGGRDSFRLSEIVAEAANADFGCGDLRLLVLIALQPMSVAPSMRTGQGRDGIGFDLDGMWRFGDLGGDDIVFRRAA